ncbi:hypothetical protein FPCIR_2066 [Fusarium pseudocircinatum]|uniref:Uncharacterized protein n=1 Tax=Fusarium pseudocircinatum TaxID=56676 RepID=A0A8H5UXT6_9HYPO|nr:hypothetical protein FPCIR_2066 [Fusarium pseudocircinatum]
MFSEDQISNASELEEWKRLQCPHGFPQVAREHFEEWMNAVQKALELGFTLHVSIRFRKPFRDYMSFREVSGVLRDPKVTVEIDLDRAAWSQVCSWRRNLRIRGWAWRTMKKCISTIMGVLPFDR